MLRFHVKQQLIHICSSFQLSELTPERIVLKIVLWSVLRSVLDALNIRAPISSACSLSSGDLRRSFFAFSLLSWNSTNNALTKYSFLQKKIQFCCNAYRLYNAEYELRARINNKGDCSVFPSKHAYYSLLDISGETIRKQVLLQISKNSYFVYPAVPKTIKGLGGLA